MSNFRPTSASPSEQLQSVGVTRVIDEAVRLEKFASMMPLNMY